MRDVIWIVLISSVILLIITLVRTRKPIQWLGYIGMNIVLAAFVLYFVNLISSYTGFSLPINVTTVATIGVLGIPGLLLLSAVKLIII